MDEKKIQLAKKFNRASSLYGEVVEEKIRERYSITQEISLNRQRDVKVEEFNEYYNYCENCKARAKQILGI